MFYSHTFLAKKSPLGTVWIAAHLESRLRKSHVAVTDISSSVNYIMFPEVPIALRLSGHLLLGVVRIYKKKVDYLFHDCNEIAAQVRTMFVPLKVNLPEDANHAAFHSITLPETFELDALDMNDTFLLPGFPDKHLRNYEEITLQDQFPADGGAYISIYLNEGSTQSTPQPKSSLRPYTGAAPMEEDVLPPFTGEIGSQISPERSSANETAGRYSPRNVAEQPIYNTNENDFAEVSPDYVMRDAANSIGPERLPEFGILGDDMQFQQENFNAFGNHIESPSPIRQSLPLIEGDSLPSPLHRKAHASSIDIPSVPDLHIPTANNDAGHPPIQPSPVNDQNRRKRKRRQLFDAAIVLSNRDMSKQLEDTSKLVRKRPKLPHSTLDVWKFQRRFHNEQIFYMPALSGISEELQKTCKAILTAVSIQSSSTESEDTMNVQFPIETPMPDDHNESGSHIVNGDHSDKNLNVSDNIDEQTPIEQAMFEVHGDQNSQGLLSPVRQESTQVLTPIPESMSPREKTLNTDVEWTLNTITSDLSQSHHGTSIGQYEDHFTLEETIPETPILTESPIDDNLNFLEADSSPPDFETSGGGNLSARTRAVAKYLKGQSPATQTSFSQLGSLSLNKILEGKTRKQCARMFSETLVLKSYDIIDVCQSEPYGEITVSLTPKLSKMQF